MIARQAAALIGLFSLLLVIDPVGLLSDSRADEVGSLVKGNSRFALNLYTHLSGAEGNLFFSPHSISTALAMTYAGARGRTEEQMAEVLHFSRKQAQVHRGFAELAEALNAIRQGEGIDLTVANALWVSRDYRLLDTYLELVRKYYRARLSYADFKSAQEETRKEINAWVEEKTRHKIRDLIKPGALERLTRLVLVNAVYFLGSWASRFDKSATQNAPFCVSPDTRIEVPMMHQEETFNYMEKEDLQVLELPYQGDDLSMIVLLPREAGGLAGLERSLNLEEMDAWLARLRRRRVAVYLPKFELSAEFDLQETLASMGMIDAFRRGEADFTGMGGSRELYISKVIHKAFVDVHEEGTEAAAATGVVVGITSVPRPPPEFRADHPFIFLIRANRSKSILFLGRLVDPRQ